MQNLIITAHQTFAEDKSRKMRTFLLVLCVAASAFAADNLVQLAEKLGAKTLVQLVTEAGLADTLATGGRASIYLMLLNRC